jgi:hypothetical protein
MDFNFINQSKKDLHFLDILAFIFTYEFTDSISD